MKFSGRAAPLALLAACLFAFGMFLPWLGFFQDDWHFIYYASQGLGKLWQLSTYDNRPFASWPYIAGFALFGFRPWAWQVAGLLLRWLTALAFWLFLRALWPRQEKMVVVPALLFAIYPLYTLQPMAVTYITHWVCYLLYFLSLWLMVLAVRAPRGRWPLLVLSIALDGVQLFTIEYFNGIELLRPVILWMVVSGLVEGRKKITGKVALAWLPYLGLLLAFIFWRGFIFQSPAQDNNSPVVLSELLSTPLPTSLYLVKAVLKDSLLIMAQAWSHTLDVDLVDFSPAGLAILFVTALVFISFYFYLGNSHPADESSPPVRNLLILGAFGLLLGPIPAWVTRQPLYDTNPLWNSRLGMAAMFGAALLVTAAVEGLVKMPRQRILIYSLLLALSAGYLLRWENIYRHAWKAQVSILNQLSWRAPGIEPGTAIVSEGEMLSLMGDYPTAFAMNMDYVQPGENTARLWYFPVYADDRVSEKIATGSPLVETKFSTRFSGNGADILVIWYQPSISPCMHVMEPEDADSPLYSDLQRRLAEKSNLSLISSEPAPNVRIFDQALKTAETWCTYFQRAELAAQKGDWAEVLGLWQEAGDHGLQPHYGAELLPFIRAFLATGQPEQAADMAQAAARLTQSQAMRQTLCRAWRREMVASGANFPEPLPCNP